MFVIYPDRIATKWVAEELLPEGWSLAISCARGMSPNQTRSDALAKDSHSVAMLVASTTETNSSETQPSVPRICCDARKPLPFQLIDTNPPVRRSANPMAPQILPTTTATSTSDRTKNVLTQKDTEQKASKYHGKTIAKQCLPPPSRQSIRRRQSQ